MEKKGQQRVKEATVIFPNQLLEHHPALSRNREIFLIEDKRFFSDFRFHKKKLLLHRATTRAYRDRLTSWGFAVHYIEFQKQCTIDLLFKTLKEHKIEKIFLAEITDHEPEQRLQGTARDLNITVIALQTPNFVTPIERIATFFKGVPHYSLTHFYIAQRKRLNILIEDDKPRDGK